MMRTKRIKALNMMSRCSKQEEGPFGAFEPSEQPSDLIAPPVEGEIEPFGLAER